MKMKWITTRLQIAASVITPTGRTTVKQILKSKRETDTAVEAKHWAESLAVPHGDALAKLNAELWQEASSYEQKLRLETEQSWGAQISSLGGGGDVAALYFLTRFRKPAVVVETGVAAGWSSRAILDALTMNGNGMLYSSDLPYVWSVDGQFPFAPLVPNRLRSNWFVSTAGDRKALPAIRSRINQIDLLHYDSDKTYAGRQFAVECLRSMFNDETILVMDDIQNNVYFRDYCDKRGLKPLVLRYRGKYLGILGRSLF